MRILYLIAENVKKLKAVRVSPQGKPIVLIGGLNGAGKSSVLDSIRIALGGKREIPDRPIREGQSHASVELSLGDDRDQELLVTATLTTKGAYLDVRDKTGKVASPQTVLDKLVGPISLDPEAFGRMSPKDQGDTLRKVLGLDLGSLDAEYLTLYNERRDLGRDLRQAESRLASMPPTEKDAPELVDVSELAVAADLARTERQKNEKERESLARFRENMKARRSLIADIKERISGLGDQLAQLEAENKRDQTQEAIMADRVSHLKDEDVNAILVLIKEAEDNNAKARQASERKAAAKEVWKLREQHTDLDKKLGAISDKKAELIASAKFPVPGLGFDPAGGVTLNGLPFDQASQAERLRVSVAVGLAANPKIRVLLVQNASLLDENNLTLLEEIATEYGAQVWCEVVGDPTDRGAPSAGRATVLIEDGEVADGTPEVS